MKNDNDEYIKCSFILWPCNYGRWEDKTEYDSKEGYPVLLQEKRCNKCNKVKRRLVTVRL